jgi:hypothetical protein
MHILAKIEPPKSNTKRHTMLQFWSDWVDAAIMAVESQSVIAMRLVKITAGGAAADAECEMMVAEKFAAVTAAHSAATTALFNGQSLQEVAALALAPVRSRVRANHERLSRG